MNLKKLRIEKNLTQEEVAKANGITRFTYSNYESGKTQADYETLTKIADYYKVTLDYLIGHDVPYLLDKSTLSESQRNLVDLVADMDDFICDKVFAYASGLIDGKREHQANIEKLKQKFK